MEGKPGMDVMIVYEDLLSGKLAKALVDRLVGEGQAQIELFRVEALLAPEMNEAAAQAAARVQLIVVAARTVALIPSGVLELLRHWVAAREPSSGGAIVELRTRASEREEAGILPLVRAAGEACGMQFFLAEVKTKRQDPGKEGTTTGTHYERWCALHRQRGYQNRRRWGINE